MAGPKEAGGPRPWHTPGSFAGRALVAAAAAALVLVLLLLVGYAADVLLLAFAGVLLAVFLRALSDGLSRLTGLPAGWSLAAVVLGLAGLGALAGWLIAPAVAAQVDQLAEQLPRSLQGLEAHLRQYGWGRRLLAELPSLGRQASTRTELLARATGLFSTTLGAVVNAAVVLFVGLFLAIDPGLYTAGLVRLVPPAHRARAGAVLADLGSALRWWLVGRLVSMVEVGTLIALGLWLLGVPLALTVALLTAALGFIPNIGPIVSAIPAVLLALTQGPAQALYVGLLYLGVQSFDGYVVTPLVQQRTVSLPPALLLLAQVLLGVLLGGVGLTLATPLAVVALVLVKKLYVEGVLEDRADDAGAAS